MGLGEALVGGVSARYDDDRDRDAPGQGSGLLLRAHAIERAASSRSVQGVGGDGFRAARRRGG